MMRAKEMWPASTEKNGDGFRIHIFWQANGTKETYTQKTWPFSVHVIFQNVAKIFHENKINT